MSRTTGVFNFGANFEIGYQGPVDARQVCPTLDDRALLTYTYIGMICVVTNDEDREDPNNPGVIIGDATNNGIYRMINQIGTNVVSTDADWEKVGGGTGDGDPVVSFDYYDTQIKIDDAVSGGIIPFAGDLEVNDLVITLESGAYFIVNVVGGIGGNYNPDKTNETWAVDPSTQVPFDIGGIQQGTTAATLDDMPFSQVWNLLLFPSQPPSVAHPTANMANEVASFYEVGTSIDMAWEPSLTSLGSITVSPQGPAGVQPAPSTGLMTAKFEGPGYNGGAESDIYNASLKATISTHETINISNYSVVEGTQEWKFTYTFEGGPMPKDSQGNDAPAQQLSDGQVGSSVPHSTFGTYPIYVGLSSGNNDFEHAGNATENYPAGTSKPSLGGFNRSGLHFSQKVGEEGISGTDPNAIRHRIAIPVVFGSPSFLQATAEGGYLSDGDWEAGPIRDDLHSSGIEYQVWIKNKNGLAKGDPELPAGSGSYKPKYKVSY
jgi:hypothetical protein